MTRVLAFTLAALASASLAPALAAQPMPEGQATGGAAMGQGPMGSGWTDPYGDAAVSRKDAEAQAAARFATLDTDKDGVLSPDELRAGRPDRGPRERRGGDGAGGRRGGGMARMLDANGDGKISRDEYVAGTLRRFDMADTNHDGLLTKAERDAAREAMRARMEERMRGMMGGGMDGAMSGGGGMGGGGD